MQTNCFTDVLVWALDNREIDLINSLLEKTTIIYNFIDKKQRTLLISACINELYDIAQIFVNRCELDCIDCNNNTALLYACYNKNQELALNILDSGPCRIDHENSDGFNAFLLSCQNRMERVAIKIFNMDKKYIGNESIALLIACEYNLEKLALTMLNSINIDELSVDSNDNTPLMLACKNRMEKFALAILDSGKSNPNYVNSENNCALLIATSLRLTKISMRLLDVSNLSVDIIDNNDNTMLIYACKNNMEAIALKILDKLPKLQNINTVDQDGITAIIYAKNNNMTAVVDKIIDIQLKNLDQVKNPLKKKQTPIPKIVRTHTWDKYIGEHIGCTVCHCCKINKTKQSDFVCGHILSVANGGQTIVDNLRVICNQCNLSMGRTNMDEFMVKYGFS